jgi:hypothetical protein
MVYSAAPPTTMSTSYVPVYCFLCAYCGSTLRPAITLHQALLVYSAAPPTTFVFLNQPVSALQLAAAGNKKNSARLRRRIIEPAGNCLPTGFLHNYVRIEQNKDRSNYRTSALHYFMLLFHLVSYAAAIKV